ncbi:MAG: ABC transporter permease subunit [Dehalococcoidia bacterium]|nr:ABC transporter permease subunit [Dehalococcoidia bacterium]
MGAKTWRIILVHILPNSLAPVFVLATAYLGRAIVAEASLSFLGLGVPPPHPSWGGMLQVRRPGLSGGRTVAHDLPRGGPVVGGVLVCCVRRRIAGRAGPEVARVVAMLSFGRRRSVVARGLVPRSRVLGAHRDGSPPDTGNDILVPDVIEV